MHVGSRSVTRVLAIDDERHGDMLPSAEGLTPLCTLGTSASTPQTALTLCSEHSDVDDAAGHASGRTETRRPSMPVSFRNAVPGAMAEHGIKVLLVEDDPTDGFLLQETLAVAQCVPFRVTQVTRCRAAAQHLAAEHWDVVLLDLSLPDSLGLETFTTLHAQAPGVPMVVLSGLDLLVHQAVLQFELFTGHLLDPAVMMAAGRKALAAAGA